MEIPAVKSYTVKCLFKKKKIILVNQSQWKGCENPSISPAEEMDRDDRQRHKHVFYELQGFYPVILIHHSNVCLHAFRFLYSDEVQIGPETVMTTLYTAKKYAVPALEAHCVEFLKKNLRADNAFMLLTQVSL